MDASEMEAAVGPAGYYVTDYGSVKMSEELSAAVAGMKSEEFAAWETKAKRFIADQWKNGVKASEMLLEPGCLKAGGGVRYF